MPPSSAVAVGSHAAGDPSWLPLGDAVSSYRPFRRACPGWADHTYGVFLPKHRQGNPGGYTAYFLQNPDRTYSMLA